ncbi:sulfotransferase [Erythrobacter sp. 3-20A1M]|uniref:sulfotransferase family protein n=1 Tax=Erythrobacter sp. 3-20A1M TaxID=2653850 RepID=UPI001BFC6CA5|nr:sulfotransferase [Erythrobacter sp. 3-20A1M]QWC57617.1 sulfotransferase [Erythrobacter sp. 3-20A1M]
MRSRFVFVAGLHRTGTSLIARAIASHPQVSAIEGSPAPENEGCYLQGAIPHTALDGIPGRFATDPRERHVEGSRYDRLETRERLLADWAPWFDPAKPWWLEKSPVNLTRMRLYQQLFPTCQFVIVLRHPQVMAAALAKWTDTPTDELVRYGVEAYERLYDDLPFLHSALVLRYEDFVRSPDRWMRAFLAFLSLPGKSDRLDVRDGNRDYAVPVALDADLDHRMRRWGYRAGGGVENFLPHIAHPLRQVREEVFAVLEKPDEARDDNPAETGKEQKANIRL